MQTTASAVEITTQCLLFDMDGVLIHSIGAVDRCWKRWAHQYGIPSADSFQVPHGMRAGDIVRMLKPEFTEPQIAAGLRDIEDMEVEDTAEVRTLPGAREMLALLPSYRWAIVTSATRRLAEARLAAARLPEPQRMVTGDMVARGKPDAEPYLRGAQLLGYGPAECIIVEDAPSGITAGRAAGSQVIGVLGTHTVPQLGGANWVVPSLDHIRARVLPRHIELRFEPVIAR